MINKHIYIIYKIIGWSGFELYDYEKHALLAVPGDLGHGAAPACKANDWLEGREALHGLDCEELCLDDGEGPALEDAGCRLEGVLARAVHCPQQGEQAQLHGPAQVEPAPPLAALLQLEQPRQVGQVPGDPPSLHPQLAPLGRAPPFGPGCELLLVEVQGVHHRMVELSVP